MAVGLTPTTASEQPGIDTSCPTASKSKKKKNCVGQAVAVRAFGHYNKLLEELRIEDGWAFRNFLRVDPELFHELLQRVGPRLTKQRTWYRRPLEPGLKLALTLRHLATGDSYHSLMYGFRVSHSTISLFVPEVCQAIIDEYQDEVVVTPTTPAGWKEVAFPTVGTFTIA